MLPGLDGFELLPHLKERDIPVIYLTAKNDIQSKAQGLTSGAEDYIVKPFEILELIVRIDKVLQRTGGADRILRAGGVALNRVERTVCRDGRAISLKPMEFDLLSLLMKNKNIAHGDYKSRLFVKGWDEIAADEEFGEFDLKEEGKDMLTLMEKELAEMPEDIKGMVSSAELREMVYLFFSSDIGRNIGVSAVERPEAAMGESRGKRFMIRNDYHIMDWKDPNIDCGPETGAYARYFNEDTNNRLQGGIPSP